MPSDARPVLPGPNEPARWLLADLALGLTVIVPILATVDRRIGLYAPASTGALIFAFILLPETLRELSAMLQQPAIRIVAWAGLALAFGWNLVSHIPWMTPRTGFYLCLPLFYAALLAWFRNEPERRLRRAYFAKLAITTVAAAWIAVAGYQWAVAGTPNLIVGSPPIYLHFRHVNPDVFSVFALSLCFWGGSLRQRAVLAVAAIISGYFLLWSAGRAAFLGLFVFLGLLIAFRQIRVFDRRLLWPLAMFGSGGLLVFAVGQTQFLHFFEDRLLTTSVENFTSDRSAIWQHVADRVFAYPDTALFGLGPDAYRRLGFSNEMAVLTGHRNPTSHPHNTVMLWLLEFGVIGASVLLILMAACIRAALKALREADSSGLRAGIGSAILSTLLFSMVDCQFYYAGPLMFFLILAAFQRATEPRSEQLSRTWEAIR